MDHQKIVSFIEASFLSPLVTNPDITDISYNGDSIYYLHNYLGRKKSDINLTDSDARDFIRQIANLTEKQFSYQNPKLDVSIERFRINAVHPSLGRRHNDNVLTFSIRMTKSIPIITSQSTFLNAELICLFDVLVKSHVSIVIGGATGSGKTEFQKYLISSLPDFSRIIIIDNVLELDNLEIKNDLDINIWLADDKNEEASIQALVKNALRSNPDWLIVAEARGKEMVEVLNSAMTGHPIITTIHALDINNMPTRIGRMVMMNNQQHDFDLLMQDIFYHFRFYVYLQRIFHEDGMVERYIKEVAVFDEKGNKSTIFLRKNDGYQVFPIKKEILEYLNYEGNEQFKKYYVGGKHE